MLIKSISPKNILSFGEDQPTIELGPLNIMVGPNGSGKSNFIECISLLQSAAEKLSIPTADWLWQGEKVSTNGKLETVLEYPTGTRNLRYWLEFSFSGQNVQLTDERIENEFPDLGHGKSYFYFAYQKGWPVINVKTVRRQLKREEISTDLSILSQRKDMDSYPEITWLSEALNNIRIYRDWAFGCHTPLRLPQQSGLPRNFLSEKLDNLGFILNDLGNIPEIKRKILHYLAMLTSGNWDFNVKIEEGFAQLILLENGFTVPSTRMSEGTLHFLCLLAILCHPSPPPLLCIEEPEIGLHPEMMPILGDLLRDAAQRSQLIVTTHSDLLVEEFINSPECVITFDKHGGKTLTRRHDSESLEAWLDTFTIGPLRSG